MKSKPQTGQNRSDIVVLAAVSPKARAMAEQGRFPDGSYARWCDACDVGSPEQAWEDNRCPDCGREAP